RVVLEPEGGLAWITDHLEALARTRAAQLPLHVPAETVDVVDGVHVPRRDHEPAVAVLGDGVQVKDVPGAGTPERGPLRVRPGLCLVEADVVLRVPRPDLLTAGRDLLDLAVEHGGVR